MPPKRLPPRRGRSKQDTCITTPMAETASPEPELAEASLLASPLELSTTPKTAAPVPFVSPPAQLAGKKHDRNANDSSDDDDCDSDDSIVPPFKASRKKPPSRKDSGKLPARRSVLEETLEDTDSDDDGDDDDDSDDDDDNNVTHCYEQRPPAQSSRTDMLPPRVPPLAPVVAERAARPEPVANHFVAIGPGTAARAPSNPNRVNVRSVVFPSMPGYYVLAFTDHTMEVSTFNKYIKPTLDYVDSMEPTFTKFGFKIYKAILRAPNSTEQLMRLSSNGKEYPVICLVAEALKDGLDFAIGLSMICNHMTEESLLLAYKYSPPEFVPCTDPVQHTGTRIRDPVMADYVVREDLLKIHIDSRDSRAIASASNDYIDGLTDALYGDRHSDCKRIFRTLALGRRRLIAAKLHQAP